MLKKQLEEYDDLVWCYSILHIKQQMDDFNAKPDEWWELAKLQFQKEMQKFFATHRRDEVVYRRHLFAFQKAFQDFIYRNPDSTRLLSPLHEEEVEYNQTIKDIKQEQPQKLKVGRHDTLTKVFEEQTHIASQSEIITIINDIST